MKLSNTYNLKALYPEIARQWHPVKNGQLTPGKVTPGSNKKVWWLCAKGHEWEAIINSKRRRKMRCPICSRTVVSKEYNLSVVCPEIAKQWHPVKNGQLTPDKVTPSSHKKVWWLCAKGHEWEEYINTRRKSKIRCPICSRTIVSNEYNLSVVCPEIAKQWHPTKNRNFTPDKVTHGSHKKVWWLCEKGHEWEEYINTRRKSKIRCPICSRTIVSNEYNLSVVCPEIARQWHPTKNHDLIPEKVMPGSIKKVWWQCNKGHEWRAAIRDRYYTKSICPYCSGRRI